MTKPQGELRLTRSAVKPVFERRLSIGRKRSQRARPPSRCGSFADEPR